MDTSKISLLFIWGGPIAAGYIVAKKTNMVAGIATAIGGYYLIHLLAKNGVRAM